MRGLTLEEELGKALAGLLLVLNRDKDGGWFICKENKDTVEEAKSSALKFLDDMENKL